MKLFSGHCRKLPWIYGTVVLRRLGLAVLLAFGMSGGSLADELRTWRDVDGRTMEAKLISVRADSILVLFKGKEVTVPLEKLSEADREYAAEWKDKAESGDDDTDGPAMREKPAAQGGGGATFDGRALELGGKINLFQFDYTDEYREGVKKKFKTEDTGYRIAIAVPAGFDPTKPQNVFVAMAAGNNEGQIRAGNTAALGSFARKGVAEGWVCIAFDSNLGAATVHTGAYECAIDKILEEWPGFKGWTVTVGGSSGGAKAALSQACLFLAKEVPVRGVFLAGCNSAANLTAGRDSHRVSKSALRLTRCFISTGKKDNLVSQSQVDSVVATVKGEGMRTIREEWFEGGHEMNQDQFVMALGWFAEEAP